VTGAVEAAEHKLADCDNRLSQYRKALDSGADAAVVAGWMIEVQGERLRAEKQLAAAQPSGKVSAKQMRHRGQPAGHRHGVGRRRLETQVEALRRTGYAHHL
jgi:hypothetical protein